MGNWGILIPILLSDMVNPVLFAFMVYAAGSSRAVLTSSMMLLGHTLAYFFGGIVLAVGLEKISNRLANPQTVDFVIEVLVGLILLWLVWRTSKDTGKRPEEETRLQSVGCLSIWRPGKFHRHTICGAVFRGH